MTSLHKPNWSIPAKCESNPEFMRLKKLCSVALWEIIIWQTHSISFSGCWHANETHLYNLCKWKTDNQISSEAINIQLGVAYAKSCSWRNSKGWRVDHSGKRREIGTTFPTSCVMSSDWVVMLLLSVTALVMLLQLFFSGLIKGHLIVTQTRCLWGTIRWQTCQKPWEVPLAHWAP